MITHKIKFPGHVGTMLAARMDTPDIKPRAYVLFAHCFTCGKDIVAASRISSGLVERGFAVLRFDFTGLGMSEGEFANTNFSSNIADLVKAAEYLRNEHQAPSVLIGHSLGGAAVLAAASEIPEVKAVVTIGAPAEPVHVQRQFGSKVDVIREHGAVEVNLGGRPFTITKQFLDDLEANTIHDRVARLGRALLVMHSPTDEVVNVDNARKIFEAARHPKSFISLDDADHLLRKRPDAEYAAQVLAAWSERYLSDENASTGTKDGADVPAGSQDGVVSVAESGQGDFENIVLAGKHRLVADEPQSVGGDDRGPTPYEYLLAGLGACTSMTIRMYAKRKKLNLRKVSVRLIQKKIHAADCHDCENKQGQITEINREIILEGNLSNEDRDKLLEIANKCPVHRTFESTIKVRSLLSD